MISPLNSAPPPPKKAPLLFSLSRRSCIPVLPLSFLQTKQYILKVGITDWVVRGMNRENEDPFSFCPFSLSALLDASELVIYWGVKEGKATLPLLGVTGIASKRSVVLALNQKYLNATFVRESNPQCMCHFAFFLRYPTSASISQMPWKVQYAVIFISLVLANIAFLFNDGSGERFQEEREVEWGQWYQP